MTESTSSVTVHVGLDVRAASIRLAAVSVDELLDERTLPHDPEAVARAVSRWPRVRCCYQSSGQRAERDATASLDMYFCRTRRPRAAPAGSCARRACISAADLERFDRPGSCAPPARTIDTSARAFA